MSSPVHPVNEGWPTATIASTSGGWVRTALVAAFLWVVVGLTLAFLSARADAPMLSGWLAMLTGPVTLVVGRRAGVGGRRQWILAGLLQFGIILVLGSVAICFTALNGGFGGSGGSSSIESVGFGSGGTDCALDTTSGTFAAGEPVRVIAEFPPDLPTGAVVTISMSVDGDAVASAGDTFTLDAPAACISGDVSDTPLATGHYRWEATPDTAPGISGEFDVTP